MSLAAHSRTIAGHGGSLAAALALLVSFAPGSADAETACRPAGNISPGLLKLLHEFQAADRTGGTVLPVQDFIVGVSDIAAADQAALAHRGLVTATKTGANEGSVRNDGQALIEFQGIFARRQTFFRVPQHIRAHYRAAANEVTLYYESGGALQLGEALPLIGIPVYRTVHHVVISPDKLLFYWGDGSSEEPDRCYVTS